MIDPTARARLIDLLRQLSFERRKVTLASGRESDFFIDCKQTILTAEGHTLVGELMFQALSDLPRCDAVGGVELGGCPLASRPSKRCRRQVRWWWVSSHSSIVRKAAPRPFARPGSRS